MTQYIYMMVGAAGAGKSTFIKDFLPNACVVSRDAARFEVMDKHNTEDYFKYEKEAFALFISRIEKAIKDNNKSIVIDATHLTPKARKRVLSRIKSKDNKLVIDAIVIRPTLEQHIKQNTNRTGRAFVPVDAIVKQYNSYVEPTREEGFNHVTIW